MSTSPAGRARKWLESTLPQPREYPGPAVGSPSFAWIAGLGFALVAVAALALLLGVTNMFFSEAARSSVFGGRAYKVNVTEDAAADMKPIVEEYVRKAGPKHWAMADGAADVVISLEPVPGYECVPVTGRPAVTLLAEGVDKTLAEAQEYLFCYKRTGIILKQKDAEVAGLEDYIMDYFGPSGSVVMTAVGDIIPARHVAEAMAEHGTNFPFKPAVPLVEKSDVVVGDLECPLTDSVEPPYSGMVFAAPEKTVQGLKLLGLTAVTLANNHSTNFGRPAFTDTLRVLKDAGIKYAGGGYDFAEAHAPAVVESKGLKFAFLSYNSIEGSIDATSSEPGVTWIRIPPYSNDSAADVKMVEDDIRQAKTQADFVVACFHWSKEYEYHPNPSMVQLAHKACDAGADMVIGQHPHSIQSLEWYNGKLIAYSLGNFIFDQRKVEIDGKQVGEQARRGFVLRCDFRRGKLASLTMMPYRINDACQTVPLEGKGAADVIDKLFEISGWKKQGPSVR